MLYPEQFLTKDLMLLDIRLLPRQYRDLSPFEIKQLLEMGLKEDGYLFVGDEDVPIIKSTYPLYKTLYMSLCETIDLPDWDRPCTLHITLYDKHRLIIRHLEKEPPQQKSLSIHVFSYGEWNTQLRDVLAPYHIYLDSPLVSLDDLVEAALDFVVCQAYEKECRIYPEFEQYLMNAIPEASDKNSQSVLGRLLLRIWAQITIDDDTFDSLYLHTVDIKGCIINLVYINKQPD